MKKFNLIPVFAMLMLTVTLTACGHTPDEEYEAEYTPEAVVETEDEFVEDEVDEEVNETDTADLSEMMISVNGHTIDFNMTVQDVLDAGFAVEDRFQDTIDGDLGANLISSLTVFIPEVGLGGSINIGILNETNTDIPMTEAVITSITLDEMSARGFDSVEMFGGFVIDETSIEDAIAELGEPNERHDGLWEELIWGSNDWTGSSIQLRFSTDENSSPVTTGRLGSIRLSSFE